MLFFGFADVHSLGIQQLGFEEMTLRYDPSFCTGCGACEVHIPGLLMMIEQDGTVALDLDYGALAEQAIRAATACVASALWLD